MDINNLISRIEGELDKNSKKTEVFIDLGFDENKTKQDDKLKRRIEQLQAVANKIRLCRKHHQRICKVIS